MNSRVFSLLFGTVLHLAGGLAMLHGQGPVSTGVIQDVSREDGILRLRPEQSGSGPIIYYGMDKADILTVAGKAAKLADITPGMQVSVFYAKQNDRWVVSKVLIPDAPAIPAVTGAPVVAPVKQSNADIDDDRTTRGPKSAATDGDRTTVPAEGGTGLRRRGP